MTLKSLIIGALLVSVVLALVFFSRQLALVISYAMVLIAGAMGLYGLILALGSPASFTLKEGIPSIEDYANSKLGFILAVAGVALYFAADWISPGTIPVFAQMLDDIVAVVIVIIAAGSVAALAFVVWYKAGDRISVGYRCIEEYVDHSLKPKGERFLIAASRGDFGTVERSLPKYSNIQNDDGDTALILAAASGQAEIVQILLKSGVYCDEANNKEATALLYAAKNGHLEVVGMLLNANANTDIADDQGNSALYLASTDGHIGIVNRLLESGASVNRAYRSGWTEIMHASANGHADVVESLIAHGAELNHEVEGATALKLAIYLVSGKMPGYLDSDRDEGKRKRIVRLLLDNGAEINSLDKKGNTPLMTAIDRECFDIASYLIEKGADLHVENTNGQTALILTMQSWGEESKTTQEMLVRRGAGMSFDSKEVGERTLIGASCFGLKEIAFRLMSEDIDLDATNEGSVGTCRGDTALIAASREGHTGIVGGLLSNGVRLDMASNGMSALGWAIHMHRPRDRDRWNIVKSLLSAGADINTISSHGNTALMVAAFCGYTEDVLQLIEAGAEVNVVGRGSGLSALGLAEKEGHSTVVAILNAHGAP